MVEIIVFIEKNQYSKKVLHDRKPKGKSVYERGKKVGVGT